MVEMATLSYKHMVNHFIFLRMSHECLAMWSDTIYRAKFVGERDFGHVDTSPCRELTANSEVPSLLALAAYRIDLAAR